MGSILQICCRYKFINRIRKSYLLDYPHIYQGPMSLKSQGQWTASALVQIMACRLFGAKSLPEPMLAYCQLDSREQISMKFESEFYQFHSRKCIWNCRLPKWRPYCHGKDELMCWSRRRTRLMRRSQYECQFFSKWTVYTQLTSYPDGFYRSYLSECYWYEHPVIYPPRVKCSSDISPVKFNNRGSLEHYVIRTYW